MPKKIAPYGTWESPITSELITTETVTLEQVQIHNETVYWLERRPTEAGRNVIVSYHDDVSTDVLPPPFNARSRVHEYGGGAYCVSDQAVFFVNDTDQDIYRVTDNVVDRLTRADGMRFADLSLDHRRGRILCVCEDHRNNARQPLNALVSVEITSGAIDTLHSGYDFYANPRVSPDGGQLAWLCWDHPNMPWDGTELWTATLDATGALHNAAHVAGNQHQSVFQPTWSADNVLYFVTDASGWWNLARLEPNGPVAITDLQSEFGLPQWVFGQTTYAFCDANQVVCARIADGVGRLALLDLVTLRLTGIDIPQNTFSSICASNGTAGLIAASESEFSQVILIDTHEHKSRSIARACSIPIADANLSKGQSLSFDTRHHDEAHVVYYPPVNHNYEAPPDELPPLIVLCHGGPTGAADASLDLRKQYWTSRGFAIADVNYSGSTGYGRDYRDRLKKNWGIRDVEDVCDAAKYFVSNGTVDPNRLIIKGSSAGGYTVLAALTFHQVFSCGASYYGISDLETLLADTHKFEAHYTDQLVGSYPEQQFVYYQRSPIHFVDQLACPVIFFQGLEDKVVPPSQAEKMVAALKSKGIPVSYVTFEHEQHGFRQASSIKTALDAELYFYSVIFGFTAADELPKIAIANVDT